MNTILSAQNLLYFKSSSELITAAKGSRIYNEIIDKIKQLSYMLEDDENDEEDLELEFNQIDDKLFTPEKKAEILEPNDYF